MPVIGIAVETCRIPIRLYFFAHKETVYEYNESYPAYGLL